MSRLLVLFVGLAAALALSWGVVVVLPAWQTASLLPLPAAAAPPPLDPAAARGRGVYAREGCAACHTLGLGPGDIARGWGSRRAVPRDYLEDGSDLLGLSRLGPDLSNAAARATSSSWHPDFTSPAGGLSSDEAADLAAYLRSLRHDAALPEATK